MQVRARNRLKVVQALHTHPGSSRATLLEHTGLSRPTLSTLLDELERDGLVERQETVPDEPRGAGRPPARLALAPRAGFAVGVDVGHTHVRAAVCDLAGRLVADAWSPAEVDHEPQESLDLADALVRTVLERAEADPDRVLGVGMGIAAPVDARSGAVHAEGFLPSWGGVKPAQELEARTGMVVRLENDANVGALGEHAFGTARGHDDVLYVRLSAGIGLGLVLGGELYGGSRGIAGELGHVQAVEHGDVCRCGKRGCLETIATPGALREVLQRSLGRPVTVQQLLDLAQAGDREATRLVEDAGDAVGRAIAAAVNVLNPELVVVGGELARTGETLVAPLRAAVRREAVGPAADAVTVVAGTLGERAEVLGAAGMVLAAAPSVLTAR